MPPAGPTRPDLSTLTDEQTERVLRHLRRRRPACPVCGAKTLRVGQALYLGFLFLSEPQDAYMVALTCGNPQCPDPHSGIKLHGSEFLDAAASTDARSKAS